MKYKEPKNTAYKVTPYWMRAIATALGRQHKVTIRRGDNWAMDMKNKVLIYTDDICFLDDDNVLALLLHEIGHIRFSQWFDESTKIWKEAPEASLACINACEDIRIDHIVSRLYEGSYSLIETLHEQSVNDGLSKIIEYKKEVAKNVKHLDAFKVNMEQAEAMLKNQKLTAEEVKKFIEDNEPKLTGRMNPVSECMYLMLCIQYGYDNHPTIKEYEKDNPMLLDKARQCVEEVHNHKIEHMENSKQIQDFYEEYIYPIIKDLIEKNKDGSEKKFKNNSGGGKDAQDKMSQARGAALADKAKGQVKKALGGSKPSHDTPESGSVDYNEFYKQIKDYITASSSKFNRILKDNKFDRLAGRFRTGELNKRRLYKYKTRDYKLFQRKIERKNKDYAFSVMMDVSYSMSGQRMAESFKGVALMSEVLNRCGVPYELSFFASGHRFGKLFDEPLSRLKVGSRAGEVYGGGTDIVQPFRELVKHMDARKEKKRIVIVLTDGDVGHEEEQSVLRIMKKNEGIEYYGIGVGVELHSLFGRNGVEVKDVSEIVPKFSGILRKHIQIG